MSNSKKILICEDEVDIAEIISLITKKQGHEVDVASDGQEGLEKFLKGDYDLVMTDLKMPRMNGIDLIKSIRASKTNSLVHIMVISGNMKDYEPELALIDRIELISKPFQTAKIVEKLNTIFGVETEDDQFIGMSEDQFRDILVKSSLAKIIESFNLMTRDDVHLAGLEKHTGRQIIKNSFFVSQILNVSDLHGNIIFSLNKKLAIEATKVLAKRDDGITEELICDYLLRLCNSVVKKIIEFMQSNKMGFENDGVNIFGNLEHGAMMYLDKETTYNKIKLNTIWGELFVIFVVWK